MLILGVASAPAEATTFSPLTIEQYTDASAYIVEGTVLEVWTDLEADSGMVWTRARVAVSDTLKGPDRPVELVVSSPGGAFGDYEMHVPAAAVFSPQEEVFLFVADRDGRLTVVGSFQGKYSIRRAPGDSRSYVRTWHTSRNVPFDARFLPHPAPEDRLYLEDLRSQVRAQLDRPWDGAPIPGASQQYLEAINTPARRNP
ncbi:MAG: hypothetical protein ABMA64_08050 [Myxococcota bacterium]